MERKVDVANRADSEASFKEEGKKEKLARSFESQGNENIMKTKVEVVFQKL